jgi:CHAT domain-containing protein
VGARGIRRWAAPDFPLRRSVGAAVDGARPFQARLSAGGRWVPCEIERSNTVLRTDCAGYRLAGEHAARAVAAAHAIDSAAARTLDGVWSLAVIDLLSAQGDRRTIEQAVDALTDAVAKDSANPGLHNDLAVAYLARASRRQDATSLFLALNEIERAARLDSISNLIAFNQALIAMDAGLFDEAAARWAEFIRRERNSAWVEEARQYQRTLIIQRSSHPFDPRVADLAAAATRDPQSAREYVLETALSAWADADAEESSADSVLAVMRAIGEALAPRDSSAAHIAQVCGKNRGRLAGTVRLFIAASKEFRVGEYNKAAPRLATAVRALRAAHAEPLAEWGDVLRGFIDIYAGRYPQADSIFGSIARSAAARGDIALQARAMWGSGLSHSRAGETATAIDHYTTAATLYGRINEDGNRASMLSQLADPLLLFGRDDAALNAKWKALTTLVRRRDTPARTTPLLSTGIALRDLGLPDAATAVLREATRATAASPRRHELAEALIQLANAEFAAGRSGAADTHLEDARRALTRVDDSLMLARERMTIAETDAAMHAVDAPRLALSRLDEVIQYYTRNGLEYNRAGPLSRRALLRLRTNDLAGARRDLEAAAHAVEEQQTKATDPAAFRDRAAARRQVFQTLIALDLELADTTGALLAADRARGNVSSALRAVADGRVILGYSVLPDAVVLSVRSKDGERLVRVPTSESRMRESVKKIESLLRRGEDSPEWRTISRHMYDMLVAPAEPELHNTNEIVIAADGMLGRLPFAALLDSGGSYLGQQHVIIYAAGVRARRHRQPLIDSAWIVGNPSFDEAMFPHLASLRGAENEVAAVRQLYWSAFVLADSAATKSAIIDALRHASLFHFAGHAELVPHAPDLSHLVLARAPGGIADNVLSAAEIARLPLANLRLVILSSCGTTQARSRQDSGESGLADAFLRAGASAVISTIWEADDDGTARLMRALHERLSRGVSPAEALRGAQMEVAVSADVRLPLRVWSAVRYEEGQQ